MSGRRRWSHSSSVQWLYVESEYDIHPVTMHSRQGVKRKSYLHLCFVYLKHRDPKRPGLLIATHDAKKHDIKFSLFPFLRQADNALASSDQLGPQGIPAAFGTLDGVLVLVCSSKEILHALASSSPDEILVSGQDLGLVRLAGLDQLAADLIGHALELGKSNVRLGSASVADGTASANRLGVVRRNDEAGGGVLTLTLDISIPLAGEDTGGERVVASVGLFLGVVEEFTGVRVQVGAADKLDTEGKVLDLGESKVSGQDLGAVLLVSLVCAKDDSLTKTLVVLAGELESPVVDSVLEHVLLGVKEEADTSFLGKLADGIDGLVQGGAGREAILELIQSDAASASELESDKVTRLGHSDRLESTLGPRHDLVSNAFLRLHGAVLEGTGLVLGKDDLTGIVENHTSEANVLESSNGGLDLGGVLAGAELGIECLLEEVSEDGVRVRVEDGVCGVGQDVHDAQRGRQKNRR